MNSKNNIHSIGVIGLGIIGSALSKHIHLSDFQVMGFDIDDQKVQAAIANGVEATKKLANIIEFSEVLITCLPSNKSLDDTVNYYTGDDGTQQVISGNTTTAGGSADLNGFELDGNILINENLSLAFTYAINDSEIGEGFQSADTFDLMGDRNAVVGNEFSRFPKNSGSLSLSHVKELDAERTRFARMDYLYTGKMYASNAMLAHTGSGAKVNLRTGIETDSYRVEAYCTNCFNDNQPKGLQQMYDLSGITGGFGDGAVTAAGPRLLSISLADKRAIGIRASYKF